MRAGRKIFILADSQHLSHRLSAASMTVEMFVGGWVILEFTQGGQNLTFVEKVPVTILSSSYLR